MVATELSAELVLPNFVTHGRVHIPHRIHHLGENQRHQQHNQKRDLQMVKTELVLANFVAQGRGHFPQHRSHHLTQNQRYQQHNQKQDLQLFH